MAKVKADLTELNKLMRSLKKDVRVRVGILGSKAKAQHGDSHLTNAELGAVHEFGANINHPGGTPYKILANGQAQFVKKSEGTDLPVTSAHNITIPARSFLRGPLEEKLSEQFVNAKKEVWKAFFQKNKPEVFFNYLGALAVHIVHNAFDSNGFGGWTELTAATTRAKARKNLSPNTLIAKGQLKNSISMKVINK